MVPLYKALKERHIPTFLCSTGQHAELLDDVWTLFEVFPDVELKIMKPGQDLFYITKSVMEKTKELFERVKPSLVVVQGDTTSAMAGALAAFYAKIPIAHVEAGLRSGNIYAPFPEEVNRKCISTMARLHFAPTPLAASQLEKEGVKKEFIFCTGNTVVDALHSVIEKMENHSLSPLKSVVQLLKEQQSSGRKIILLTAHRRESFDGGLFRIFSAVKQALEHNPELFVIFPVHPNPVIRQALRESQLDTLPNIAILPPLLYHNLVYVMNRSSGVATDSGGISEEAVSLKKPVLILRNETDRPEAVDSGFARLVGTDGGKILSGFAWLKTAHFENTTNSESPFGDGNASQRIAQVIEEFLAKAG